MVSLDFGGNLFGGGLGGSFVGFLGHVGVGDDGESRENTNDNDDDEEFDDGEA